MHLVQLVSFRTYFLMENLAPLLHIASLKNARFFESTLFKTVAHLCHSLAETLPQFSDLALVRGKDAVGKRID